MQELLIYQRWSRGHKARGQGQGHKKNPRPRKDSLSEDRHSRGQGQECSRPRPRTKDTSASALQKKRSSQKIFRQSPKKKKKKRSSQKFFKRSPQKNVFQKIFQAIHKILTIQKIVLSSRRGQANFRGLEASRPRPRTSKCVLEDSTSVIYTIQHRLQPWYSRSTVTTEYAFTLMTMYRSKSN